jgi:hypothetical protein
MTVTYRTMALHLPPTPLGLLPARWAVEHWCNACRQRVISDLVVAHARGHESVDAHNWAESFPPPAAPGTMTPGMIEPNTIGEVSRG